MSYAYRLKNLSFSYNGTDILKNISLNIRSGELLSIVGPNGAGKSTLLKCLAGLLKPTSGEIRVEKDRIGDIKEKELAKKIGYLPQNFNPVFSITAFDIVMLGRAPHLRGLMLGGERDKEIVKGLMDEMDCLQFIDRDFGKLSAGEQKRVLIAKALAPEPSILLLDEPVSNLDLGHSVHVNKLLKRLNDEQGITIINISHNLNIVSRFSQRIVLMKDGQILSEGKSEDVLTHEILNKVYGENFILIKDNNGGLPVIVPKT